METTGFAEKQLDIVRQIIMAELKNSNVRVYLFGSRATEKARRHSDIDVAILPASPIEDKVFVKIRNLLKESNVIYNVDIVDLSKTSDNFRQRVIQEGVLWTE